MLGEHLQAGRITRERETPQRVEPFPGALPQLRVEAPAPASFTAAQPMSLPQKYICKSILQYLLNLLFPFCLK